MKISPAAVLNRNMEHSMGLLHVPDLWQNHSSLFNYTVDSAYPQPSLIDNVISLASIVMLFFTMVSLGCTMEASKIKSHIVKPKGVAIAVVAQYGVMPLTAFSLSKMFKLGPVESVVVLICGCCPGGSISNILALALQGDMNLSIVMTSCSTALALGMMPLLLYLYCQGLTNMENVVPYVSIMVSLAMTMIPCSIGVAINYYRPQYSKVITRVGLYIMALAAVVTIALSCVSIGSTILAVFTPSLLAISALMPFIGFTCGYILSSLFRLNCSGRRTVAMETGCQNIQLCFTILKMAFSPEVVGLLYLFPMLYIAFQLLEAAILIVVFRCHQRFKVTKKDSQNPKDFSSSCPQQCGQMWGRGREQCREEWRGMQVSEPEGEKNI